MSCSDGLKNGTETGVDCGGSCGACAGTDCASDADCATGDACVHGFCAPQACATAELHYSDFASDPAPTWQVISGTWSWDGASTYANTDAVPGAESWLGFQPWTDTVTQVRMRLDAPTFNSGFLFRAQVVGPVNDSGAYYYVGLTAGGALLGFTDGAGQWNQIATVNYPVVPGTFYEVQVSAQESHLRVAIDGNPVIDLNEGTYRLGSVGLRTFDNPATYDHVLVCATPKACAAGSGCESGVCQAGTCRVVACGDGQQNNGESAVDCGGLCAGCGNGLGCGSGADCQSGSCQAGVCRPATCADGQRDGDETDVDCGGSCLPCAVNLACGSGADCQNGSCAAGYCRPATCNNGVQDPGEEGIDCGGGCGLCAHADCVETSDCAGGALCTFGSCHPLSSCGDLLAPQRRWPSGSYALEVTGTLLHAYCDMDFDDGLGAGGWTLYTHTGAQGPGTIPPVNSTADRSAPGRLTLADAQALANLGSQVLIRSRSFPDRWISSVPNARPIQNLRSGLILNWQSVVNSPGADPSPEWNLSPAVSPDDLWSVCGPTTDPSPSSIQQYPNVYHACGNGGGGGCANAPGNGGMHVIDTSSRFYYGCGDDSFNEDVEVYVR